MNKSDAANILYSSLPRNPRTVGKYTAECTITQMGIDFECEVTFDYSKGDNGVREYNGGPLISPPSPAEVDVFSVELVRADSGKTMVEIHLPVNFSELSADSQDAIEQACHEEMDDRHWDGPEYDERDDL